MALNCVEKCIQKPSRVPGCAHEEARLWRVKTSEGELTAKFVDSRLLRAVAFHPPTATGPPRPGWPRLAATRG